VINSIRLLLVLISTTLSGCTNLFFFPDAKLVMTPDQLGLKFEERQLEHPDGTKINVWYLSAEVQDQGQTETKTRTKGTVLFFHGNAQNISAHIGSVYWLPKYGYNVILIDYQGYGISEGSASVKAALQDIKLTLKSAGKEQHPLIAYGQSIGAALLISALAELKESAGIDAAVFESPFASYQQIAREKLGLLWLTWPLQYPLSLFISDHFAPDKAIQNLPKIPLLFIHSRADTTVPYHHSEDLFALANSPKEFWRFDDAGHINIFRDSETRGRLVHHLETVLKP
jgi:fermentation-respiration switch protein FrsA (DUF1100 family)